MSRLLSQYTITWASNQFTITYASGPVSSQTFASRNYVVIAHPSITRLFYFGADNDSLTLLDYTLCTSPVSNSVSDIITKIQALIDATNELFQNKVIETNCFVADTTDTSKNLYFDLSGATTLTRTTLAFAQSTSKVISFPDRTDTVVLLGGNQVMSNKSLVANNCAVVDLSDNTKKLQFALAAATTGKTCTLTSNHTNTRSITLPDTDTTLAGLSVQQIFTALNTFSNQLALSGASSQVVFQPGGSGNTLTLSVSANPSASRALTFGDPGGNDSIAYLAATQALTGKTVTFQNSGMSGGTAGVMAIYYTYSTTATFVPSGGGGGTFTVNPTGALNLVRLDGFVLLSQQNFNATLNTATITQLTASGVVPSVFRPARTQQYNCFTQDGATGFAGICRTDTSGNLIIFKTQAIATWTNGNAVGLQFDMAFSYGLT
jgi:hypothetical protein